MTFDFIDKKLLQVAYHVLLLLLINSVKVTLSHMLYFDKFRTVIKWLQGDQINRRRLSDTLKGKFRQFLSSVCYDKFHVDDNSCLFLTYFISCSRKHSQETSNDSHPWTYIVSCDLILSKCTELSTYRLINVRAQ